MKLYINILALSFICGVGHAQTPIFDWTLQIGNNSNLYAVDMVLDNAGNIYHLGDFSNGPTDFDPGPGTFNLTTAGGNDIYISKLDSAKNFIWAKRFGGIDDDQGRAMAVDDSGNVYFTGYFNGVADFDPGSGVYNLTAQPGGRDIFVCKLDANGDFVWAKQVGGTSYDEGNGIAVDASGVYFTGNFYGTVDFDPGAGIANLTSNGMDDLFLCKLNSSGNFQWAQHFGSTDDDYGNAIVLDNSSNVFLTGSFTGTVDFDPGTSVFNLTCSATSRNCFILKLSHAGNFYWATQLSLPDDVTGNTLAIDGSGNIFVGGGGPGMALCKLDAMGNILWGHLLTGSNANAHSVAVDVGGNVYVAGSFRNSVDFDPSASTALLTAAGGFDAFLAKFDTSGNYLWAYPFGDTFQDYGVAVALDAASNIYSYGQFRNTTDFDPGTGIYNLTSFFGNDSYLLKWNPAPVGIEENVAGTSVLIYPNPTNDWVNIGLNHLKDVTIKVYSANGQLIYFQESINTPLHQVNLSGSEGIHFIEIFTHGQLVSKKVIKR